LEEVHEPSGHLTIEVSEHCVSSELYSHLVFKEWQEPSLHKTGRIFGQIINDGQSSKDCLQSPFGQWIGKNKGHSK